MKRIILWIKLNFVKLVTWIMVYRIALRIKVIRFMWNRVISPLYIHYENRVVWLIENGKINPQEFVMPMRLSYYHPSDLVVHDDRYDYGHYER